MRILAARLRDDLAAQRAAERRRQPGAAQAGGFVDVIDLERDAVRFRIDVAAAVLAGEAVVARVPARVAEHRLRPAVLVAGAERLLGGEDRMLQLILGRQRQEGRAVHLGVGGIGEEAERVLDAPGDLRNRQRRHLRQGLRSERSDHYEQCQPSACRARHSPSSARHPPSREARPARARSPSTVATRG